MEILEFFPIFRNNSFIIIYRRQKIQSSIRSISILISGYFSYLFVSPDATRIFEKVSFSILCLLSLFLSEQSYSIHDDELLR